MNNSLITAFLNDADENRKLTAGFLNYASTNFSLPSFPVPKPFRLVRSVYCNEFRLISEESEPVTLFYIRLFDCPLITSATFPNVKFPSKNPAQCMVWTSLVPGHEDAFKFLASHFFLYFLDQFNLVVPSVTLTLLAANFWESRLKWCFDSKDIRVIHADLKDNNINKVEPKTWKEFMPLWSEFLYNCDASDEPEQYFLIAKDPAFLI